MGVTFEEFARNRLPVLLRYAVVLTGDRDLAQDLVQEVLAKACAKWGRVSKSRSPDDYVHRMLINEHLSWRRSWLARKVRVSGEQITEIGDAHRAHRDPAQDYVEADELWRRLGQLGRRQRTVLVLRYYEQLDDAEIAYLLRCTEATVRSHASRGLKTLRLSSAAPTAKTLTRSGKSVAHTKET